MIELNGRMVYDGAAKRLLSLVLDAEKKLGIMEAEFEIPVLV